MPEAGSRRGIRLLMTADAVGGVWNYAIHLARELAPYDVEILLAVMGPEPDRSQREEVLRSSNLRMTANPFPLEWSYDFTQDDFERSGEWLLALAREFEADVVQVNGYAHAALSWERPAVVVAHSCVYSWWESVYADAPPPEYAAYRERVMKGLRAASLVAAPTRWMLETLRRTYELALPNARVISNFTSVEAARVQKQPFIFACGRFWDRAKNIRLLNAIAPDLTWPIHVAGDIFGPDGGGKQPGTLNLLGRLSSAGVWQQLSRASIFAHPAKYEPFGLSVLEAARSGCALVLADIPSLRELWDGAAVFVAAEDAGRWKESLNALAASESDRAELAEKAVRRSEQFVPHAAAAEYFSSYDMLRSSGDRCTGAGQVNLHETTDQVLLPLHCF